MSFLKVFNLPNLQLQVRPSGMAALCSALVLAGCAALTAQAPADQVKYRAGQRWQALVAGKFDSAYAYNTPGFRTLITPETYRSRIGSAVKWVGTEVTKVECPEAAKCDVQIRLDYQPLLGGKPGDTYSTYLDESWLLEDGQWWIYQPLNN